MRYFVALEIPEEDKEELEKLQEELKALVPGAKLTDPDKLHLTLVFIGEQPDSLKESLVEIINHSVRGIAPFEVTPSYIDGFPNIHKPNTIWVGVKGDVDKLHNIRERMKDGLKRLNLPVDERRFVPHIAIAKANNFVRIDSQVEEKLQNLFIPSFKPIIVTSIKLFESIPDQGLHKHNTLAEIKLS